MLIHSFKKSTIQNAPTALLAHGRAFGMSAMSLFERFLPSSWNILYIQAPHADPDGGFCWWQIQDKEDPNAVLPLVTNSLDALIEEHQLTQSPLIGIGFSQGAALLSMLLQVDNGLLNAAAMLAGFVVPLTATVNAPNENSSTPILMAHGSLDEVVTLERALEGAQILCCLGFSVEFHTDNVGHKVGTGGLRALKTWLLNLEAQYIHLNTLS